MLTRFKHEILLCLISLLSVIKPGLTDRTSKKIYYDVTGQSACFRRFNATHQIGCSSSRGGNEGILHYVDHVTEIDWLLKHGPHQPYVTLLTPQMFVREHVDRLRKSGKVSGMLVINVNETRFPHPKYFSPDQTCPNSQMDLYHGDANYAGCENGSTPWNPHANAMMFDDFEIPVMVLMNETEIDYLIDHCYEKFNKPDLKGNARVYPLCGAQVKDAMDGARDTPTCIRRSRLITNIDPQQYCDPLGDQNVYGFLHPVNNSRNLSDQSVVMAVARMDTFSMFDKVYPGANSPITGLVSILAAAEALATAKDEVTQNDKPIAFVLFTGEAFDYMGSERMVYEMERKYFPKGLSEGQAGFHPIELKHIDTIVEVGQVGLRDQGKLWLHSDPRSQKDPQVKSRVTKVSSDIKSIAGNISLELEEAPEKQPLPPASAQSFLKKRNISSVLLSDSRAQFQNKFYNSRFDLQSVINHTYPDGDNKTDQDYVTEAAVGLQKVATLLARTMYTLSTGKTTNKHIQASNKTVTNLLYCLLESPKCDLFNTTLDPDNAKNLASVPYPLYVSVYQSSNNQVTRLARNILAYFLGDRVVNATKDECKNKKHVFYNYIWISGPVKPGSASQERDHQCIQASVDYSLAKSPAFDIEGYDWSTNQYSAWSESRWATDAMLVRVFLKPSMTREVLTLCTGIVLLLAMFALGFLLKKRGHLLFIHSTTIR